MPPHFDPRSCPSCLRPRGPLVVDLGPQSANSAFIRAQKIERAYSSRLRTIARHVGDIIRGFDISTFPGAGLAQKALERYARALTPWAEAAARLMTAEVASRDERSWQAVAATMGREMKKEIANAPTGRVMQVLQSEQVVLIKSLPLEAAERVQRLARESLSSGARPETLAKLILETESVTASRARTIARTETSRAATVLTQARAEHIGSTHFIWRTAGDTDVRGSHAKLNGKVFRWDDPPVCDAPDLRALPGAIFNCRCHPEPVIPDDL